MAEASRKHGKYLINGGCCHHMTARKARKPVEPAMGFQPQPQRDATVTA
jgi:hypothetical protein